VEKPSKPVTARCSTPGGDHVRAGDVLAYAQVVGESVDVLAPHAGVLEEIGVPAGERFRLGEVLARLAESERMTGPDLRALPSPPPADDLPRKAVDKLSAMVAYWDADQRCRFANLAYERWFGVRPQDLVGRHISELLGPLYALNRPYIEAALQGEPQEFEREIPDPTGGTPRHSLANYMPDVVDGVVRGFFVLVTDISAVKRTQIALRESEERFRLTLDEAPIGMALVGTDGHFLRVNRALCEILGYAAGELVGMTFQAVTHPDDLDADLALAGQLARGEIPRYMLEKRYIRKDGSIVHIKLSGSVLRDGDGRPLHFIAQVEDVTERKRIEQEQLFLTELGPVLESTLDEDEILDHVIQLAARTMADFCIVDTVGEDGQVQRKRLASRDPARQPLAQSLLDIKLDRTRPYLLSEAIQNRRPVLLQRPSDAEIAAMAQGPDHLRLLRGLEIVSMLTVPLLSGDRLVGAIALIATRGSPEYDQRDLRLAGQLAWRTAMCLENARLYRVAREATTRRDDVLAIVAHDLRNPLSTIAMQAALLRRRAQPRAGAEAGAGEVIQRAAARMTRLIEDLLDVSRMEGGRLTVERTRLDAGPFLSDCVDSQRALADAAGVDLRLDLPEKLPGVWADRDRLSQVLENLIGNALKFTSSGGSIIVGAEVRQDEVLFRVRDTGAGITPEHLPHVFDRFWQARRAERQGAGLGLPIAKGVVEAHAGRIWVESTPGAGTCFFFTIPRADAPQGPT
jgi:PAS domain S-box-containing protein